MQIEHYLVLSWPGVVEVFQMPESVLQRLQLEGSTKGVHLLEEDRKSAQGELEGGSANVTDPCPTETYLSQRQIVYRLYISELFAVLV